MPYMYVDFDLSEVDEDDLIEEIESRGHKVILDGNVNEQMEELYLRVKLNKPYEDIIRQMIWDKLGKIV